MDNKVKYEAGQILVAVWGATMVIVDYFRVTHVSPSGKTVTFVGIPSKETSTGFLSGTSVPDTEAGPMINAEVRTRRVQPNSGSMRLFETHGWVRLWDGKARHYDHCD